MEFLANAKNMHSKKPNFEYGFRPNYYYSRAIGLWPFTIVHDANETIQNSHVCSIDVVWFLASICLYLISAFYVYGDMIYEEDFESVKSYTYFIFHLFLIVTLLSGACGIVLDMFNRRKLVNVLQKFIAFDNEVRFFFISLLFILVLIWFNPWNIDEEIRSSFQL